LRTISVMGRAKVVCIGNVFRRDDGAAHRVADLLSTVEQIEVARAQSPIEILNHVSRETDTLIIVDAVENISEPGRIHIIDPVKLLSGSYFWRSTHTMTLPEVVRLLETLDIKPSRVIIFGIEGADFKPGLGLSEQVEKACAEVASEIKRILGKSG